MASAWSNGIYRSRIWKWEWCKLELGLRELVLTLKEGLDSKLRNLYKPLELRFPLRSISMDAWDLTKPTLGWNSKNTELSFAKWLTLSRFLEILVSCKKLWRLRLALEFNGDKNEDEPIDLIGKP